MASRRPTSSSSPTSSALPLAATLAAGGVVLVTAGYFGYAAYERARSRREEAERLARPWLSKKKGGLVVTTVDSAAAALAALTSSSCSSPSCTLVVADLSNKGMRSFRLAELAGVTSADLSGNDELDLVMISSPSPPQPPPALLLLLPRAPPPLKRFSLSSLRSLNLSRCGLTAVPRGLARACPNLSDLDLSHNELRGALGEKQEAGEGDLFPKSLLRLNAQGNRGLTSVAAEALAPLSGLVLLGLKSCSLESLPGPALGKLTRLRELYLTDNRLRRLPREIGACTALVKLQASFNELETLPLEELAGLPRLEMLRAAACRISSLPGLEELVVGASSSRDERKENKKSKGNNNGGAFRSLCWLSLAGNPLFDRCVPPPREEAARVFALDEVLGGGEEEGEGEELGSGASGDVVAVRFDPSAAASSSSIGSGKKEPGGGRGVPTATTTAPPLLAFKRFRGDAGPDGRAIDEVSVARAVSHGALASTVGTVVVAADAAAAVCEGKKSKGGGGGAAAVAAPAAAAAADVVASSTTSTDLSPSSSSSSPCSLSSLPSGLLLELIEGKPLADKPRGDPLLRCTWPPAPSSSASASSAAASALNSDSDSQRRLSPAHALVAAARLASALAHLHGDLGCAHGDFYAHNVLCDRNTGRATLVDFGAAFFYRRRRRTAGAEGEEEEEEPRPSSSSSSAFEAFEQRAFGIFLRELAEHGIQEKGGEGGREGGNEEEISKKARRALERAAAAAADAPVGERPGFSRLARELAAAARDECGYEGEDLLCVV